MCNCNTKRRRIKQNIWRNNSQNFSKINDKFQTMDPGSIEDTKQDKYPKNSTKPLHLCVLYSDGKKKKRERERNHGRSQDRKRGKRGILYLQEEKAKNDSRFQKPCSYKRGFKYLKCWNKNNQKERAEICHTTPWEIPHCAVIKCHDIYVKKKKTD